MRFPGRSRGLARLLPPSLRVFALPAAARTLALAAGILVVSVLAGAIRVLPLLLAPGVPLRLGVVLGRGVLGVALETALLVAPPIGWALAAARIVDRGEARALAAIGVRPLRLLTGTWPSLLAVALAAGLAAAAWGTEAASPGALIGDLSREARAACMAASPPAAVPVPLTGISWVCLPGEAPRAVGVAPFAEGSGPTAPLFSASALTVASDLRALTAEDLELLVATGADADDAARTLHLHVGAASIRGVPPLARASNLAVPARAALVAGCAVGLAWLAAAWILGRAIPGNVLALALGAAGPVGALLTFSALEREAHGGAIYAAVPLAGMLGVAAIGGLAAARERRLRRCANST